MDETRRDIDEIQGDMDQTEEQGGQQEQERSDGSSYDIKCRPLPNDLPGEGEGLRRLLKKLEEKLEDYEDTEATKKFTEDLKTFEKEYTGIADLVKKYEVFHDKIDCMFAEANNWKKIVRDWCDGQTDSKTRAEIVRIWDEFYESAENEACKEWIGARDKYGSTLDCLKQSERKAEEAKEDFETVKNFEKSVKDRFAELKALFDQSKTFNENGEYTSVCAVALEFCATYNEVGLIDLWEYRRKCGAPLETSGAEGKIEGRTGGKAYPSPSPQKPSGPASPCDAKEQYPFKTHRTPDQYRKEIVSALRELILAKFDYFRRWQERIELEADSGKKKKLLETIQKNRQKEFFGEVRDIPTEGSVANA